MEFCKGGVGVSRIEQGATRNMYDGSESHRRILPWKDSHRPPAAAQLNALWKSWNFVGRACCLQKGA